MKINKQKLENVINQYKNLIMGYAGNNYSAFYKESVDKLKLQLGIFETILACLEEEVIKTETISTQKTDGTTYQMPDNIKVTVTN